MRNGEGRRSVWLERSLRLSRLLGKLSEEWPGSCVPLAEGASWPSTDVPCGEEQVTSPKGTGQGWQFRIFLEVWHHQDSVKPTQTQTRPGNWTRLSPCLLAAFSSLTHTATSLVSYLRISQIAFFHWLPFPNVLSHCSVAGPESQMRCWHTKTVPVYKHVLPRLAAHPQKIAAKNLTLLLLILFLFFQI